MISAHIHLRSLLPSDREQLAHLANDKSIWDNVRDRMPYPYSVEDADAFIAFAQNKDERHIRAISFEDQLVGVCGLHFQTDVYQRSAELGYWLGQDYWGRGLATQAVKLLVQEGFQQFDIIRLFAKVFAYNQASMHVLQKNNFVLEGISRLAVFKNGDLWDEHNFALLKPGVY